MFLRSKPDRSGSRLVVFPYVILAILGVVLACGVNFPWFTSDWTPWTLFAKLPGASAIRAPARSVFIVIFAMAILFGRAIMVIGSAGRFKRISGIAPVFLVAMVMLENFPMLRLEPPVVQVPEVYRWVETLPEDVVVAESPCFCGTDLWAFSADYMMYAAIHGHAIANGYSRYVPETFPDMCDAINHLPSPDSIRFLKNSGIDFIIIHPQMYFHDHLNDLFSRAAQDPDPITVFNEVTKLSNNHYQTLVSGPGYAMELACLQSPHMDLVDRFGRSLVFYLNDPNRAENQGSQPKETKSS